MIVKSYSSDKKDRKNIALSFLNNSSVLVELISEVHRLVQGRGIKRKVTAIKKAVENDPRENLTDSDSDVSFTSERGLE